MTGPHLDDDAISAHLDALQPEAAGHLAACAPCRNRLSEMQAVLRALATPPPPPRQETVDRAVATALASVERAERAPVESTATRQREERGVPAAIASLPAAASGRRWLPSPAWLAVAAAAVAGLLAVPALLRDDRPDRLAASGPTAQSSARAEGLDGGAPVFGPDLGDQSDPSVMVSLISEAAASFIAPPDAADDHAELSPAPGPVPASDAGAGAARSVAAAAPAQCVAEAQAVGEGRLGRLVYVAPLRWKGAPATVLVFALTDGGRQGRQAYVMSVERCALLAEQRF